MVPVMQVDRYLGDAKRVIAVWRQTVPEPNDARLAIFIQDHWARIPTIEPPDICLTKIRVEPMRAGAGFQFVGQGAWPELSPALMWRSVGLILVCVSILSWLRVQVMGYRWKRNRQRIHKRCM